MDKIYIVYWSQSGNTEAMGAEVLEETAMEPFVTEAVQYNFKA